MLVYNLNSSFRIKKHYTRSVEKNYFSHLSYTKRYVPDVQSSCLTCDCGANDWYSRLWSVRNNICWYLASGCEYDKKTR
jgi:hypothetical protein